MPPVKMTRAEYQAKYGGTPSISPAPTQNIPASTNTISTPAIPASSPTPVKMTRVEYQAKYGGSTDTGSTLGNFAKGLVSAPLTMLARPFQAGAELLGASAEDVNKFSSNIPVIGGAIAPVPQNFSDVQKDIGRGAQTVALGLGPVSGGALFGAGSSLEQGNDLLSTQTLYSTLLGMGLGKAVDLVGKPLLNAAGKVIGTITPATLKDVVSKGAGAVENFMAQHEILPAAGKEAVKKLETGAQAFDTGVGKLFTGGRKAATNLVTSQYPGISKEGMQTHFQNIDKANFEKPATQLTGYSKASDIYKNAKAQGTDLSQVAVDNGISHDTLIEGNKYNTNDTADAIRNDAMKTSHDLMRPALAAAEPGVERVPVSKIRTSMLDKVDKIPASQITDTERAVMKNRIENEFGDNSPAALAHPQGYSLTDLHDSTIAAQANGKFKSNGTASENFPARVSREQAKVFGDLLGKNAPDELGVKKFKQAIQQKFQLADYLDELHGKKVPRGIVRRAVSLFGKVAGAGLGGQIGGGIGGVAGYHMGGVLFNSFDNLSNPLKAYYLNSIEKTQPEIFKIFQDYLGTQETAKLLRPKLPAPTTIYQRPTQAGIPYTPNQLFGTTPVVKTEKK